ncbi:MAG: alpha/beta hydrolase [Gammaproteobacteria bacterium]|nr:alpha/beta hydrolase [Gammaproteobacteria bacterium]
MQDRLGTTRVIDDLIEMRGLRFHYRDWQAQCENAPTLVLLHGFSGHARSWDFFAETATDRFRVLALDQRGHGETDWSTDASYGVLEMKEDLVCFVRALGLDNYYLVGLSMGGMVAMNFAGDCPVGLQKLVIVDIAPEIGSVGARAIQERVRQSDEFDSVEQAFERARAANPIPPDDVYFHRVRHSLMRTENGKWTYRYDRAYRTPGDAPRRRPSAEEGWQAVARISVPTMLVRGEHSPLLTREIADKFVGVAEDCTFVEIPGSGHSVPLDKPKEFGDAVLSFL